jgi:hypothetical protein
VSLLSVGLDVGLGFQMAGDEDADRVSMSSRSPSSSA